jgi:hypothetical protein
MVKKCNLGGSPSVLGLLLIKPFCAFESLGWMNFVFNVVLIDANGFGDALETTVTGEPGCRQEVQLGSG